MFGKRTGSTGDTVLTPRPAAAPVTEVAEAPIADAVLAERLSEPAADRFDALAAKPTPAPQPKPAPGSRQTRN